MKFDILNNGEVIETKDFGEGSFKIGRSSTCDIYLKSASVSKQHALLVIKGSKAAIVDLGSSNGVFVNGILVRKQRIEIGDDVAIASFRIRIHTAQRKAGASSSRASAPPAGGAGNLAQDMNFEHASNAPTQPAALMDAQEKMMHLMDEKILAPFYQIVRSVDWRMLLLSILGGALISAVLLSVIPIVKWGRDITTKESLARAHTVTTQTVRENYRIIAKTNDYSRMTVESCEAAQGVLSCIIVDPKSNTVLAPTKLLNKSVSDIYTSFAVKKIVDGTDDSPSIETDKGPYIIADPIYAYSAEQNDRALQAVVVAEFEVPTKVYSTFQPLVEAALFAVLCSLTAYFFIFKMFTYPILTMQEQLDAALKGEEVTITAEAKSDELENLANQINFVLSRMKQANGGIMQPVASTDSEAEDQDYVRSIVELDPAMTDGLLVLDKDKKVAYVGHALEELISMRNQYAQGQNISDACRDQSFAGTAIDLADRVNQSLGETQAANLDINGINRAMVAIGRKNRSAEIRFVLIIVKLGEG